MGGAVSAGEDNDELIDNLVGAEYIKSKNIEAIFRAVDRGDYYEKDFKSTAYRDTAWKHGYIHLSAPCIYSEVMEALELRPGHSFLNIGSGTGYLSTMVGLMIGPSGINHGIEIHEDVVEYAQQKLEQFKERSAALYKYDFCEPIFMVGNGLDFTDHCQYDRIYVGAAISPEHEQFMRNILKVGGILVVPLGDQLLQVKRVNTTEWTKKSILPVSFASLIRPVSRDQAGGSEIAFPDRQPLSLKVIARMTINNLIRTELTDENPDLIDPIRSKRGKKQSPTNGNRVKYKRRVRIARRLVAFVAASREREEGQRVELSSSESSSGSGREQAVMEVLSTSSESESPIVAAGSKISLPSGSGSDTGLGESVTSSGSLIGSVGSSLRGSLDEHRQESSSVVVTEDEPVPGTSSSSEPLDAPRTRSNPMAILPNSLSAVLSHVIGASDDEDEDVADDLQAPKSFSHDSSNEDMDTCTSSESDGGGNRTTSESSTTTSEGMDSVTSVEETSEEGHVHVDTSSDTDNQGDHQTSPLDEFGYRFQERIQMLPLPTALKVFLNYERPLGLTG